MLWPKAQSFSSSKLSRWYSAHLWSIAVSAWRNCRQRSRSLVPVLAHQNRTIAIASDFRVDGAKSPEIPQKEGVLGSEIAAQNRKSLSTFHRTLKSQCSTASLVRRRTNVQQLTCKIDLSNSFYYLFFSFVILELKPSVLKGKVSGEKLWKSAKKCEKVWKIMKRFCPLVVAL